MPKTREQEDLERWIEIGLNSQEDGIDFYEMANRIIDAWAHNQERGHWEGSRWRELTVAYLTEAYRLGKKRGLQEADRRAEAVKS